MQEAPRLTQLHPFEVRLIASLRGMKKGTIETIKIHGGLPIIYSINFDGIDISRGIGKHKLDG